MEDFGRDPDAPAHEDLRGRLALAMIPLSLGPSLGHVWAGEPGRGAVTAGLRLAIGLGAVYAGSTEGLVAGLGAQLALSVYDIVDAPQAARRTNERARVRTAIAPMVGPGTTGVSVAGSF